MNDIFYKENFRQCEKILTGNLINNLDHYAGILIKPEAFAKNQGVYILKYFVSHGFYPIASKTFKFNRNTLRNLRQYQINCLSISGLEVRDLWSQMGDVIYIIFSNLNNATDNTSQFLTASNKITQLKGSSNPSNQKKGELRFSLDQDIKMLNFVHSTDETADLIREIGVLFDYKARGELITKMKHGIIDYENTYNNIIEIENNSHDFNIKYDSVISLLFNHIHIRYPNNGIDFEYQIYNFLSDKDFESLFLLIDKLDIPQCNWFKIVLAAKSMNFNELNERGLIPSILKI